MVAAGKSKKVPPKERIFKAARELFALKGFHAASTAEIATNANVSIGHMYRLFVSKYDLVVSITNSELEYRIAKIEEAILAVERRQSTPLECLRAIARHHLRSAGDSLTFEILAEASRNNEVFKKFEGLGRLYRERLRSLAAVIRPDVSEAVLDSRVRFMISCFFGLESYHFIYHDEGIETISDQIALLLESTLFAPVESGSHLSAA